MIQYDLYIESFIYITLTIITNQKGLLSVLHDTTSHRYCLLDILQTPHRPHIMGHSSGRRKEGERERERERERGGRQGIEGEGKTLRGFKVP